MRNKIGTLLMGLGTVLVLAALSLFLWNEQEAREAERSAEHILPRLVEQIEQESTGQAPEDGENAADYPDPYDPAMTEVVIDGYAYIGYLSIPSLGLELPVMSEWDYTRLKIAPCRYSGSTKTDDLVIAGHNYARHFSPIKGLKEEETVYFVDMDGVRSDYQVASVEVLAPTAVEEMTSGTYDLTLFTCTYGGRSRVAVRCQRTGEDETAP